MRFNESRNKQWQQRDVSLSETGRVVLDSTKSLVDDKYLLQDNKNKSEINEIEQRQKSDKKYVISDATSINLNQGNKLGTTESNKYKTIDKLIFNNSITSFTNNDNNMHSKSPHIDQLISAGGSGMANMNVKNDSSDMRSSSSYRRMQRLNRRTNLKLPASSSTVLINNLYDLDRMLSRMFEPLVLGIIKSLKQNERAK